MKRFYTIVLGICLALGCKETPGVVKPAPDPSGDYADASYSRRGEGYDWIGVRVRKESDSTIRVSVRSRADRKKPTCTFDALATKVNDTVYRAEAQGNPINFIFSGDDVNLQAANAGGEGSFGFFCSGGATLEGLYSRINGRLDPAQVDPRTYQQSFIWKNMVFDIDTRAEGGATLLQVAPHGLEIDNRTDSVRFKGSVSKAEIGDLNGDTFPEILIYLRDTSANIPGNLIGFSVNNGKSMSRVSFPDPCQDITACEGYRGGDYYAIKGGMLVRNFPVYKDVSGHWQPTGNTRRLEYKLVDGEASRKFVLTNFSDHENP